MRRSKRIETLDQRPVNLDGISMNGRKWDLWQ